MGVAERKAREFKQREEEILKTAYELFKTKGLDTVTIDMIADEVEIGKGTIYQHFKSKHEIYARLVLEHMDKLQIELNKIDKSASLMEQAGQLIRAHLKYWLSDIDRHRVLHLCLNHLSMDSLGPELKAKVMEFSCKKHSQHYPIIEAAKEQGLLIDIPPEYAMLIAGGLMTGVADMLAGQNMDFKIGSLTQEEVDFELLYRSIETVLINGLMRR